MKTKVGFAPSDLAAGADPPPAPGSAPVAGPARAPMPATASGKSGFPALGGFWGRRDENGELVPLSSPDLAPPTERARRRLSARLETALVLGASGLLSFLVVFVLLAWRRPAAPVVAPAPPPVAAPAPVLTPAPPPAARARPAPRARAKPAKARRAPAIVDEDSVLVPSGL